MQVRSRFSSAAGKTAEAKAVLEAGKRFLQTAPAAERNALQSYVGMVNNMLANLPAAKAAVKK